MKQSSSLTLTALLACAALACSGGVAGAQGFNGGSIVGNGFQPPVKGGGVVPNTALPPPPGLPGATKHAAPVPSEKPTLDVPPTEALFEAIDRGDLTGARDALSRGADMSGRNVLGMTPIDLSIDLGRNDITFLLLSLRGGASDRATAAAEPPAPLPGKSRPAAPSGAARAAPTRLAATVRAVRPAQPTPLPPAGVRYAGANPGGAVPQAGFLGFGGGAGQ